MLIHIRFFSLWSARDKFSLHLVAPVFPLKSYRDAVDPLFF